MKSLDRAVPRGGNGYISASVYADKYGIDVKTAVAIARRGNIDAYRNGISAPGTPSWFMEDKYDVGYRYTKWDGDSRRCGKCLAMLPASEYYNCHVVHRRSQSCKMCCRLNARRLSGTLDAAEQIVMENHREANAALLNISQDAIDQREARIAALTAKYAAAGECGDGEEWPYEE